MAREICVVALKTTATATATSDERNAAVACILVILI